MPEASCLHQHPFHHQTHHPIQHPRLACLLMLPDQMSVAAGAEAAMEADCLHLSVTVEAAAVQVSLSALGPVLEPEVQPVLAQMPKSPRLQAYLQYCRLAVRRCPPFVE